MADKVYISAEEIESVMSEVDSIVESIYSTVILEYGEIQKYNFYIAGSVKEEVETILKSNYIGSEAMVVEQNVYSKIQSLAVYYGMIQEFSMNALQIFQENDEKLAELYQRYSEEMLNSW